MPWKNIFLTISFIISLCILIQTTRAFFTVATTYTPDASIFYTSAKDVLQHTSPYTDKTLFTAFNYPLVTAIFFIPFTFIPYFYTQIGLVVLNSTLLEISIFLSTKLLKQKLSWIAGFFLFCTFLLFFPFRFTVGMGQVNMIGFVLILWSFFLWTKNRMLFSSVLFVVAICIKPILLFLLLFFLFQKSWKWLSITLLLLLGFVGASVFFFPKQYAMYLTTVIPHLLTVRGREVYYNQGLSGFIARLTTNTFIQTYVTLFLDSCVFLFTIFFGLKKKPVIFFSILLTTLLIIDSLSWQHHFVFLILPFITLYFFLKRKKFKQKKYAVLFLLSFVLVAVNIKNPQFFASFPASLILSHQLYGTLLLLFLEIKLL